MLTQERLEKLADFLKADAERANKLAEMSPEEAVQVINDAGNDFTVDEVKAFGEGFKTAAAQGELSEDNLDQVSGGSAILISAAAAKVYLSCIAIGVTLGTGAGTNWKW